jgi:hypothetical protein
LSQFLSADEEKKRMVLSRLLLLQIVYCLMGIGYNVASYLIQASGGGQLSTTTPAIGAAVMICYGLFLIPGYLRSLRIYRILMLIAIIVIGYGGIVKHVMNYARDPSLYRSLTVWIFAVGINLYGLCLNVMASLGRFTLPERNS